jgi:hypothetical protein
MKHYNLPTKITTFSLARFEQSFQEKRKNSSTANQFYLRISFLLTFFKCNKFFIFFQKTRLSDNIILHISDYMNRYNLPSKIPTFSLDRFEPFFAEKYKNSSTTNQFYLRISFLLTFFKCNKFFIFFQKTRLFDNIILHLSDLMKQSILAPKIPTFSLSLLL